MIVKAVSLQPLTRRDDFQHNLTRIKEIFSQIIVRHEEYHDKMVVVLPEYVTGMATSDQIHIFLEEMQQLALKYEVVIIGGSFPQLDEENGRYRNFSPIIDSSGKLRGGHYKIQLFRFERKQQMIPGSNITRWELEGLKIGQLICSDMWHPDMVMQMRGVDILCVPIMTSVPNKNQTSYARWSWYCLAATRSKENVIPIIVSDSAEGNWWGEYWVSGASSINDPSHRFLPEEGPHQRAQVILASGNEGWLELDLDLKKIEEYRKYREEVGLLGNDHHVNP